MDEPGSLLERLKRGAHGLKRKKTSEKDPRYSHCVTHLSAAALIILHIVVVFLHIKKDDYVIYIRYYQ